MSTISYYSLVTIAATIAGAFLPFYFQLKDDLLKRFLALSSGVIIGYTLFHLIPEFISFSSINFVQLILITLGFYLPILINKGGFVEVSDSTKHRSINAFTFVSFAIHAFFDGVLMLSSKIHLSSDTAFFLILLHRIPITFSLMTIIKSHMKSKLRIYSIFTVFALMTPIGLFVTDFAMLDVLINYSSELLAFTSGILLYIAFYHLIYEHKLLVGKFVQFIFAGFFFALLTMVMH